jgi:microfibrillar-associated protein 1
MSPSPCRWKLRELKRVKRERQERRAAEAEKNELERRRKLTDAERAKEDEEFRKGRADHEQDKEQWKFLQKYAVPLLELHSRRIATTPPPRRLPSSPPMPPPSLMIRYYHKGAYFQDEDTTGNNKLGPVMMQDFGGATGNDKVGDKSTMPAPMQVKNFGMRSQVKWTHLSKEDTMGKDRDKPMWAEDKRLAQTFERKQAGNKGRDQFDRPSAKRVKK